MKKLCIVLSVIMVLLMSVASGAVASSATKKFVTITYTDGADGTVFAPDRHVQEITEPTIEFTGSLEREGYEFQGWSPTWKSMPDGNVTYVATWEKIGSDADAVDDEEEDDEDVTTAMSVGVDDNGDTVTTVSSKTGADTANTSNEGRQDTIGSDVDTGDVSPVVMIGGVLVALALLGGVIVYNRKRSHSEN